MAWTTPTIDSDAADGLDYVHLNKIEANVSFLAGGNDDIAQSTDAATAYALAKRDVNADIAFRDIAVRDVNVTGNINSTSNAIHVAGLTAGDEVFAVAAEGSGHNTTYAVVRKYRTSYAGTIRIKFALKISNNYFSASARIYKNGVAYGTERSTNSTTYVAFSEDLAFADGDTIEIWAKVPDDDFTWFVSGIQFCSASPLISYGWIYIAL